MATAQAQREPGATGVGKAGDPSFSVGPAQNSDVAPGPPAEILALPWTLPQPSALPSLQPTSAPPLQLKFELPPVFGLTPFAQTTFEAGSVLSSTQLGVQLATGPIHAGTRFGMMRDDRGLWLRYASHLRFVAPHYDLGLESINDYALTATPVTVQSTLLGSAGVRVTPDAPTVRVSSSLLTDTGGFLSGISAFGMF